jgi:hypothetical protein
MQGLGDVDASSGRLVEDRAGDARGGQHPGAGPGDGVAERPVATGIRKAGDKPSDSDPSLDGRCLA